MRCCRRRQNVLGLELRVDPGRRALLGGVLAGVALRVFGVQ